MSNANNDKLDWMYKGATSQVDREEYLLGKSVDKSFEQLSNEDKEKKLGLVPPKNHVEHECIPPSIRDYNKIVQQEQVDLSAKLQEDPLVAIKKQEEEARRQFLQNPIQLKKLQEAMQAQETKKKKKKRKKNKQSDSEDDLDRQLSEKLRNLKGNSVKFVKKDKKKSDADHLDVILMHKFNQLKDKLSQKDIDDIMAGKSSDSEDESPKRKKQKKQRSSSNDSNASSDESRVKRKTVKPEKRKYESYKEKQESRKHRDSSNSSVSDHNARRKNKKEVEKEKYKKYHESRPSSSNDRNRDTIKNDRRKKRSSSSSDGERRKPSYKEPPKSQSSKDEDLDKMILEKLRMLRDSKPEETGVNKANNLTEYSYDSDKDEYVLKKKSFGLVRSDGTKIPLNNPTPQPKEKPKKPEPTKPTEAKKTNKRLSEKEKEELRRQMMCDAVERDKERSDNLKRHRQENRREESNIDDFDKNFVHRELSKSQRNIKDVETRIKSKLNNIQRSTRHMDSNFSKRS